MHKRHLARPAALPRPFSRILKGRFAAGKDSGGTTGKGHKGEKEGSSTIHQFLDPPRPIVPRSSLNGSARLFCVEARMSSSIIRQSDHDDHDGRAALI